LRRLVQTEVEDRLSDAVLSGKFSTGEAVVVDVEDDKIMLRKKEAVEDNNTVEEEALPTA
jgi:ATP-dependent Clp protease ATP-binding subunit ClpA